MAAAAWMAAPGCNCTCVHEARLLWGLSLMPARFIFLSQGALCTSSVPPDTFPVLTLFMADKSTYISITKKHSTDSPMLFWHRETRTEIFKDKPWIYAGRETTSPPLFTLHSPHAFSSVIEQHANVSEEHSNTSSILVLSAEVCLLKINKQCRSLENWNSQQLVQTIMDASYSCLRERQETRWLLKIPLNHGGSLQCSFKYTTIN